MLEIITKNEFFKWMKSALVGTIASAVLTGCENQQTTDENDPNYDGSGSLNIVDNTSYKTQNRLTIQGHVKNDSLQTLDAAVYFTLYDSSRSILLKDKSYTSPKTISPGAVSPFEKTWIDQNLASKVVSYDLRADSE
jgi:hypothetical protein